MLKKKALCLVLILCAALVLTACQQQETFPTQPRQDTGTTQQQAESGAQQLFTATPEPGVLQMISDGSYDPTSEEGGGQEAVSVVDTPAPTMVSEYAGATPVKIDPVDKPTPTPLVPPKFSYATYTASNLHLTFDGPAGWMPNDTAPDMYTLTNPDPSMDYAASVVIRTVAVGKDFTQKELIAEVKAQAEAVRSAGGFRSFDLSQTAVRFFIGEDGVYIAYTGTLDDDNETGVAGRIIVNTVNKTLYVMHVSYPRGLADTFADGVYNKVRHSMKLAE